MRPSLDVRGGWILGAGVCTFGRLVRVSWNSSREEVLGALFYLGKSYGYFKTLIKYLLLVGSFPDRLRQNYLPLPLCSYNLCTHLHFSTNVVFFGSELLEGRGGVFTISGPPPTHVTSGTSCVLSKVLDEQIEK